MWILHDSHHRFIGLGRHDVPRHHHDLLELGFAATDCGTCLRGIRGSWLAAWRLVAPDAVAATREGTGRRYARSSLVAVEVGVVRAFVAGQVQSKGTMVQDFHAMRHDRHLVERRASVKNNQVVIAQMAFHKTRVEGQVIQMLDEA